MVTLQTEYLGLTLKNPIVVSSSGLTNSVEKIKKLEEAGAAAVILKSLFEEQMQYESDDMLKTSEYPEADDYVRTYVKSQSVDNYISLIKEAKASTNIPIIASINCITGADWISFAKQIEEAGADAIEVNMHILPMDKDLSSEAYEQKYVDIIKKIRGQVSLPLAAKIGSHFTNLPRLVENLYVAGAKAVVLFNRFYEPDIDITKLKLVSSEVFSTPADIRNSLRWIGVLSSLNEKVPLSASTGVHDAEGAIKQLLAGATTVQVCSTIYKNGVGRITEILKGIEEWMPTQMFESIDEVRGVLSYKHLQNPAQYERAQFMKYFSSIE